jgi:DNA-binding MarR family transcriptional regulator/GNAT superfamily N-acetyltransferase
MLEQAAPIPIDSLRSASRQLVRQLGFMGGAFAGTDLSPSAVHALIEIEPGGLTARDLAMRLNLDKSSVSRMLRKLIEAGDVIGQTADDGRVKVLSLTESGQARVAAIHAFARTQVSEALGQLEPAEQRAVLEGLTLYAGALVGQKDAATSAPTVEVLRGYQTGLIARIIEMHAHYYARASGFGRQFEAVVAGGLAEFCARRDSPGNAIWAAMHGHKVVGSIAIDGEDLGEGVAHLRWFIMDDGLRGSGAGRKLLRAALDFVDAQGFAETHLWTFSGLNAARHLYETEGFVLEEERPGTQWGMEVMEQRFVRRQT